MGQPFFGHRLRCRQQKASFLLAALPYSPALLALLRGERRVGTAFGRQRGMLLSGEVLRDDLDILVFQRRGEAFHDGILTPALAVLVDRARDVILMLAGETRIRRRNGDPIL